MADIVERLRAMNPWTDMDWPEVKNEAAEEITALRARIEKLEKALEKIDTGYGPNHLSKYARDVARAALTEAKG